MAVLSDVFIAIALCILLWGNKTSFKRYVVAHLVLAMRGLIFNLLVLILSSLNSSFMLLIAAC
jgi:hypothetical protein